MSLFRFVPLSRIAALALASVCAVALQAEAPSIPVDWSKIVDKPRKLLFEAEGSKAADGARWIRMNLQYEVVLKASLEDAVDAYWFGIERAPEVFERVDSVRVLQREANIVIADQLTGVRILGLAFLSQATFRSELERASSDEATIPWTLEDSDGSIRDNSGSWYFKALGAADDPMVYIRYKVFTEVEQRFPGQLAIMRAFGPQDIEALMGQFAREVYRVAGH